MKRNRAKAGSKTRAREAGKYRVFISYSHDDVEAADALDSVFRNSEFASPMWDRNFRYGHGFHQQIKMFIAHSHVFLPVISESSSIRGWVHQEIGYAMALNVPVLPIAIGETPGEMIQQLQAIRLDPDPEQWERQLRTQLTREVIEHLVADFSDQEFAPFQCAEDTEDRARLMVQYADEIRKLGYHGLVRQGGALTSFHIPRLAITNRIWKDRYGPMERGPFHCKWQRRERLALQHHADHARCRLVINPELNYGAYGERARIVRLNSLLEFLKQMPEKSVEIAIDSTLNKNRSVTIVGDWFAAEAVASDIGKGYFNTVFTRHAPTVRNKIEQFDQNFNELLRAMQVTSAGSCAAVVRYLEDLIQQLEKDCPEEGVPSAGRVVESGIARRNGRKKKPLPRR